MRKLDQFKVLLLNKNWNAIGICCLKRSLKLVFKNDASIIIAPNFQIFNWDDWSNLPFNENFDYIKTPNIMFRIPEVILLHNYNQLPKQKVKYGRHALFKRDNNTCCYCGEKSKLLTTDHILPRAQGGKSTWENCVTSCLNCNSKKGNRTPEQANMKLQTIPKKPKFALFKDDMKTQSWKYFLNGD